MVRAKTLTPVNRARSLIEIGPNATVTMSLNLQRNIYSQCNFVDELQAVKRRSGCEGLGLSCLDWLSARDPSREDRSGLLTIVIE